MTTHITPQTKTFTILKRGRKYFECQNHVLESGLSRSKLIINDISTEFEIGRVVTLQVNDLSERSKYGTRLIFEPVSVVSNFDREKASALEATEKLLRSAENHVKQGLYKTNAIVESLRLNVLDNDFPERLVKLKQQVKYNEAEAWLG